MKSFDHCQSPNITVLPYARLKLQFFYYCPGCPTCPANAIQMSLATWAIYAIIKKYNPKTPCISTSSAQWISQNHTSIFDHFLPVLTSIHYLYNHGSKDVLQQSKRYSVVKKALLHIALLICTFITLSVESPSSKMIYPFITSWR